MTKPTAKTFRSRQDWLTARARTLGGSDIPAALFEEGNRSPLVVQYEKLGELPPWEPSPRYQMGLAGEPIVSAQAEERLAGLAVVDPAKRGPTIYYNADCPAIHVTPDRFALKDRPRRVHPESLPEKSELVLSLKTWTASRREMWGETPPLYALIQLQAEMLVTGVHMGAIAVSFGLCEDFSLYPNIEFHAGLGERIRNEAPLWWERHIIRREPIQARASDRDLLKQIYPTSVPGSFLVLTDPSWQEAYRKLQYAKQEAKRWEEQADNLEAVFKQRLGEAELAVVSDTEAVSWKTQVRNDPPREAKTYTLRVLRMVKPPKEVLREIEAADSSTRALEIREPFLAITGELGSDGAGDVPTASAASGSSDAAQ